MKAPTIPRALVELGRAVELDTTTWLWTWNKKDKFVVASSTNGKRLFIFPRPSANPTKGRLNPAVTKGKKLFKLFNRRSSDELLEGKVKDSVKIGGKAIHIIYNSDKFGKKENYIHSFETMPHVWVDNFKKPSMIVLTGGNIKITSRGIEG